MAQLNWQRDELILACALTHRNGWKEVKAGTDEARELSDLLQLLPLHPQNLRPTNFRSPGSVQWKTANLVTAHADHVGGKTRGGALTSQIVGEFHAHPAIMLTAADQIATVIASGDLALFESISLPSPDEEHEVTAREGRTLERVHRFRERSSKLRQEKIRTTLELDGVLQCGICSFDFAHRYGDHGSGFIEVHHVRPLHELGESLTSLNDLILLCANCHRMCHRRLKATGTWPTPQELRTLL